MASIAGITQNIIIGVIFGTAGVLLKPIQEQLDIGPDLAASGIPLVILGSAVMAPVAGVLASKYSLRLLVALSGLAIVAAWIMMAVATSYAVFAVAYGLLLGPALAVGGMIFPPTLVTRWFNSGRGLAIGLVHLPIIVSILPVATNWVVEHHGNRAAFIALAGLSAIILLAAPFVRDYPPGEGPTQAGDGPAVQTPAYSGMTIPAILRHPLFWAVALANGAMNLASVVLGVHFVSMGEFWGFSRDSSALFNSTMAMSGILGAIVFGAVVDRLGGARTLAVLDLGTAVLIALLLLSLPYAGVLTIAALLGIFGGGMIPALSRAVADALGPETFSRAYALSTTVMLPLSMGGPLAMGAAYRITGNYAVALVAMAGFLAFGVVMALYAAGKRHGGLASTR
jgi:cyanate permease